MKKYDVAAYVWPAYTGDEGRSLIFWPEGYGEWETVRMEKARFEGHKWPRKPLWGYLQPDDIYGYGYLEAVKSVFKESDC